jgi:hypothetical protein
MYWTIEYIRDGLELTRSVEAESLGKAWALSFELEDDPAVEVTDVYMADSQKELV